MGQNVSILTFLPLELTFQPIDGSDVHVA